MYIASWPVLSLSFSYQNPILAFVAPRHFIIVSVYYVIINCIAGQKGIIKNKKQKKAGVFLPLLLPVLRLGYCQWNWVVVDATVAFAGPFWNQLDIPIPFTRKSSKSRLPDAEITRGCRSTHLSYTTLTSSPLLVVGWQGILSLDTIKYPLDLKKKLYIIYLLKSIIT